MTAVAWNNTYIITYKVYYHISCCNMFGFACPIIARSQFWLFALISVFPPKFNFRYLCSGLKDYISK